MREVSAHLRGAEVTRVRPASAITVETQIGDHPIPVAQAGAFGQMVQLRRPIEAFEEPHGAQRSAARHASDCIT